MVISTPHALSPAAMVVPLPDDEDSQFAVMPKLRNLDYAPSFHCRGEVIECLRQIIEVGFCLQIRIIVFVMIYYSRAYHFFTRGISYMGTPAAAAVLMIYFDY